MINRIRAHGTFILLAPALLLCCALAQTAPIRIDTIASALRNKEFDKALALLHPALQSSPRNAELWTMEGVAYAGTGNNEKALASFHNAINISPDDIAALKGSIQIEYQQGSPHAIPLLRHMLRLRPSDETSHGMLAVLEYQQGNCVSAAEQFERAGNLFDTQLPGLHAYATCLVKLKQPDKAAAIFQRALALNPDDRKERCLLASVQLMAREPQPALTTLRPLLQGKDPDAEILELAAAAEEDAGDTSEAVSMLKQAILLDPRNVNLYLDFANISYTHQSFQVGINVISDGIEVQPDAASLYFARGVLYVQSAQYDKAEADFEKSYQLDPNQSLSAAAQSLAAAQQNDFDRALAKVRASLARKPDDPFMLYLQADILASKNDDPGTPDFQLALRSARKAVALQPTLGVARGVLAKLYLEEGHNQEAIEQCRKALETDPNDQTVVYHLIQGLRKTGNTAQIPELLKRMAQIREQASKKERELYRYKLVEGDTQP
ncbi:MAG: tetratricopeptide repeat protein [Terriglobales bacterium]